jgi:hypothetical protein
VLGLSSSGTWRNIYLPSDKKLSRIVFAKQTGTGGMRFYPTSGQYIYDDSSANTYFEVVHGEMGIFVFVQFMESGTLKNAWVASKFSF